MAGLGNGKGRPLFRKNAGRGGPWGVPFYLRQKLKGRNGTKNRKNPMGRGGNHPMKN